MDDTTQDRIKNKLAISFVSYVDYATKMLTRSSSRSGTAKLRIAHIAPHVLLKTHVDSLEDSKEFRRLVSDYREFVGGHQPKDSYSDDIEFEFAKWTSCLPEFFRRSQFYLKAFKGDEVSAQSYFDLLLNLTPKRSVKITRLWMCAARFPQETIDLGSLQIRKYTRRQLDTLLGNEINQIFYPDAAVNSKILSKYWFVKEEITVAREGLPHGVRIFEERTGTSIQPSREDRPELEPLEREFPPTVLQFLALGDWTGNEPEDRREFFSIPCEMQVDDDVLAAPGPVPYVARSTELEGHLSFEPEFWVRLSKSQVAELRLRVEIARKVLDEVDLEKYDWQFVRIALGYLAKAFLTKYELDQLLWYLVVLESLFGEEGRDVGATLRNRLAKAIGATEAERKTLRGRFGELYDFRSTLVHGKSYSRKAQVAHLAQARDLARQSVLWFLKSIAQVHSELLRQNVSPEKFPRRRELLEVLDLDKESSGRLRALLNMTSRSP